GGGERVVQRVFGAVRNDHVLRSELVAVHFLVPAHDGGLHLRGAGGGRVVRLAAEGGLFGRLAYVLGRVEVRFAQAEVEDRRAGRAELTGLRPRGYRGGRLNGRGQFRNADHGAFDLVELWWHRSPDR